MQSVKVLSSDKKLVCSEVDPNELLIIDSIRNISIQEISKIIEYAFEERFDDYNTYSECITYIEKLLAKAIVVDKIKINKCKCCGNYYLSKLNSNSVYCERIINNNMNTCRKIGADKIYREKMNGNPIIKSYLTAYKKRYAWIASGKMTKEEFRVWSALAREMRDKCFKNKIALQDFNEWLFK